MIRFENPLDPTKDGANPLIDGIRYNIRNSELIKEEIIDNMDYFTYKAAAMELDHPIDVLDYALASTGHDADELTISDEHELIDVIMSKMSWLG